jgi:hypothetical protein
MHPLDGSFLKLSRARYHFQAVNDLVEGFFKRDPYQIIDNIEINGNKREHVLRFKQFEDIPNDVPLIIGDICNNLRSALDHLLWQLWVRRYPTFDETVYFPIYDCESSFVRDSPRNIGPRKAKRMGSAKISLTKHQRTLIESAQPYKTRNPALSFLRDINKSDKHRLIQVIFLTGNVNSLSLTADTTNALLQVPMPNHIPVQIIKDTKIENDTILYRVPVNNFSRGTKVQVKSRGIIKFAFEGCETAHGQIIYDSIVAMLSEVMRIIVLFEPEFARFGVSQFK